MLFTEKVGTHNTLKHTLMHYVLWNAFIEATAAFHLPLERIDAKAIRDLLTYGGVGSSLSDAQIDAAIRRLTAEHINSDHTDKGQPLTWHRLHEVDAEFAILAQLTALRHGYEIDSRDLLFRRTAPPPQQHCKIYDDGRWGCWLEHPAAQG